MKGKLVAFTGLDCAGKTSAIRSTKLSLEHRNISTMVFENHAPYSAYWNVYKKIAREFAVKGEQVPYELDRFMQAFELCLNCEETLPQLMREFGVVLSDRYVLDKIIYGRLRGKQNIAERALQTINFRPDLTIFLDVSVETAIKRIKSKGGPEDWKEHPEMLYRAHQSYNETLKGLDIPIVTICAEKPLDQVVDQCVEEILKLV